MNFGGRLLSLLGQQFGMNLRQNAALSNGDAVQHLAQFLVVADGQLKIREVSKWNLGKSNQTHVKTISKLA